MRLIILLGALSLSAVTLTGRTARAECGESRDAPFETVLGPWRTRSAADGVLVFFIALGRADIATR